MVKLSAKWVERCKTPGRYADGDGLYLLVRQSSKQWSVRYTDNAGIRLEVGLGGFPRVTLAQARQEAIAVKDSAIRGRPAKMPTFREAADRFLSTNAPTWRNPKTVINSRSSLETYAYPAFGSVPVNEVRRSDVLAVLEPLYGCKPAAGRKLRQRLRAIFANAMAREWIADGVNPAGEGIDHGLPKTPAVAAHFRAMPYAKVPDALGAIGGCNAASTASTLCLRFLTLTAVRSGEARGATWDEIDLEAATWTIPAKRMKADRVHRVPLSRQAMDVLAQADGLRDKGPHVFPSPTRPGKPLSDMTLTKILRSTGLASEATVHGFRSSFRDWVIEQTSTPWAVGESALAHSIGNSTEQAYARSDLFNRRRELMQQWADYCAP